MPELKYTITGDNSGIVDATNKAIANIENLTSAVNSANASLQFKNGIAALDKLGQQLLIVQGNTSLFGDSVKLQTQELSAYQGALNSLLANGFDPLNGDVQNLKTHIDELTTSIKAANSVKLQAPGSFINDPSTAPSAENIQRPAEFFQPQQSELIKQLNLQLEQGAITAKEYQQALDSANTATNALANSSENASVAIAQEDGYIQGLKQAIANLNQARITAPEQDLAALNAELQQTEIALQQAGNVGKVGFDNLGNAIKGVSVTNINGQLLALNNNLFGGRQIAKDFTRALADGGSSITAFARNIGLLAVDFLYYAQNAQFAAAATTTATTEIVAGEVATSSATVGLGGLGAAFGSLLTPVNAVILGVALVAGGLVYLSKNNKTATEQALAHAKALKQQKEALDDYISTLNSETQAEVKGAEASETEATKLNVLYEALQLQISAGKDYNTQLRDLENAFPQFFANIDAASGKTNDLAQAYKNATEAVKQLGLVSAASQLAGNSNLDVVKNQAGADSLIPQLIDARNKLEALQKQAAISSDARKILSSQANVSSLDPQVLQQQQVVAEILKQIQQYNQAVAEAKTKTQQFYDIAAKNQNLLDQGKNTGILNNLEQQLEALKKIQPYITDTVKLQENIAEQKQIQAQIDAILGKNAVSLLNSKKEELTIQQQIAAILAQSGADATKSGLTGYALQVADITTKYNAFYTALDKVAAKIAQQSALFSATNGKRGISPQQAGSDTSSLNNAKSLIGTNESKQLSDAEIADAQSTADAITKINNDFGVKQEAGFNEELARIKKLYDTITNSAKESALNRQQIEQNYALAVKNANGNEQSLASAKLNYDAQVKQAEDAAAKIKAAQADLLPAIQAVDQKYIQQEQQTYDKITDIAGQAFEALDDGEAARTDKIILEYQKRTTAANAYFDKLRDLAKASTLPQSAIDNINTVQSQVNNLLDAAKFKQVSEEISKNFASAMQSSVQGFVENFYTSITSLGATRQSIDEKYAEQLANASDQATKDQINRLKELEQASTTSFGAIFSSLVSKFNSTFNESILNSFTKQFTENLGKTLIKPTADQLKISPEEQAAQNVSATLKTAGSDLAEQIKAAGADFYSKITNASISPDLLSGASGGSSIVAGQSASTEITAAGTSFSANVSSASATLVTGASTAATSLVTGANTAAASTKAAGASLASKIAGAAAGLSLIGGVVSGATSPTSVVGQGIGGALQGAGEGALIGSAIPVIGTVAGAVVGGLIGGISGIFSASKAQKELQQQQLAQQQEQTALLKASLAYTSSIIGRQTANGVVTNINVGAFGQLVATVSGSQLQFVLDRSSNGR